MGINEKDNLIFLGAVFTNQETDVEFKKRYFSLSLKDV
jgi:hypothetical protein